MNARILTPVVPPGLNIKLLGLGGVGGTLARYLALYLAAQSNPTRMVLIDGDSFEPGNAGRMIFGSYGNKAAVTREELLDRIADSLVTVEAVEEFVTPQNVDRLVREGDVVILAVDNHATRKLVSDHCQRLRDVCLISGGNDGIAEASGETPPRRGTYGNVQIFRRLAGRDVTPSLTRHHPEVEHPADRLPSELSCTALVASVPQILFVNLTVAAAILNALWLYFCDALPYDEVVFDIAEGRMRPIKLECTPCATI
jgi:hypothetical protein